MNPLAGMAGGGALDDFSAQLAMWAVMMAAMMLPSAMPMLSVYAGAVRTRPAAPVSVAAFLLGYLSIWMAYSVAAALAQTGLVRLELLTDALEPQSVSLIGALLVLAGLYQWAPAKQVCLHRCRTPLSFLLLYWREGAMGAVMMGVRHGLFCAGCCWALMLLLFAGGVMNPLWIVALATLAFAEKTLSRGPDLARLTGLAMASAGAWILFAA
jgi:predicted metal-binding membrane protein